MTVRRTRAARRGFTLVELMVTIGVIVVLFASVVYGVGAITGAKAKESAGELANAIRTLYDTAALTGKTCRLVFELPGERSEDTEVTWHAECAKGGVAVTSKRLDELRAAEKRDKKSQARERDTRFRPLNNDQAPTVQELMAREKARVDEAATFSTFESEGIREQKLPSDVRVHVWTSKLRDPVKSGPAYLYFFPQGFTERAQVYVRQGSNVWTITLAPLTGKVAVVSEELEVPRS